MITLALAYISAKYNMKFEFLYLGTFIIDLGLVDAIVALCRK